jgi:HEAT repeat protein
MYEFLINGLSDEDRENRQQATQQLRDLGSNEAALNAVLSALPSMPPRGQVAAIDGLSPFLGSNREAAEVVAKVLTESSDENVKATAASYLAPVANNLAVRTALIGTARESFPNEPPAHVTNAISSLRRVADLPEVVAVLNELERHAKPAVRRAARGALGTADSLARRSGVPNVPTTRLLVIPDAEQRGAGGVLAAEIERAIERLRDLGLSMEQERVLDEVLLPRIRALILLMPDVGATLEDTNTKRTDGFRQIGEIRGAALTLVTLLADVPAAAETAREIVEKAGSIGQIIGSFIGS